MAVLLKYTPVSWVLLDLYTTKLRDCSIFQSITVLILWHFGGKFLEFDTKEGPFSTIVRNSVRCGSREGVIINHLRVM